MPQPRPLKNPPRTPAPRRGRSRPGRSLATLVALSVPLALAACGADPAPDAPDGPDTSGAAAAAFPVSVTTGASDSGEEVTIAERPDAIVSLSPTATETLWAVGAGDQVVAVDDQSDHPADVPRTKLSGHTPNVEAILGHEPDLVLTASDDPDLVAGLEKAAVPTLVVPSVADLDGAYEQIGRIGEATGHPEEAADLVEQMRSDIEAAVAAAPQAKGLSYFHELDPTLYSVTGDTFIGEVYELFGMESIADAAGGGDDYPQLSAEYVVDADPDVILLSDAECCGVTPEQVAERPGWAGITAVEEDRVEVLDEDIASRWGPRIVDLVEMIGTHVADLEPTDG